MSEIRVVPRRLVESKMHFDDFRSSRYGQCTYQRISGMIREAANVRPTLVPRPEDRQVQGGQRGRVAGRTLQQRAVLQPPRLMDVLVAQRAEAYVQRPPVARRPVRAHERLVQRLQARYLEPLHERVDALDITL